MRIIFFCASLFGLALLISLSALSTTVSTVHNSFLYSFSSDSTSAFFGQSVSFAGDVNQDGYPDIAIGIPKTFSSSLPAEVKIYSGKNGTLLQTFFGQALDHFGVSITGFLDVDQDGYGDIAVGAPQLSAPGGPGYVKIFSGRNGSTLLTVTGPAFSGFGIAINWVGDINRDGFQDFIVGAPLANSTVGQAFVISGQDGSTLLTLNGTATGEWFGLSVSSAGDINQDFIPDVIVGSPYFNNDAGRAQIFSGLDGSLIQSFSGVPGDNFGFSVSRSGFDRRVMIGAPQLASGLAGYAEVYEGSTGIRVFQFSGQTSGDMFGWSVVGYGNTGNFPSFLVGAPGYMNGKGSVHFFDGQSGQLLRKLLGPAVSGYFGHAVHTLGDVNLDGKPDFVTGAPYTRNYSGAAFVFSHP